MKLQAAIFTTALIGVSLSEPHTDKFRFCRVYIYIYIYICAVRTAYRMQMDKMATLCVALCVRLKYLPRTASNEKEIIYNTKRKPRQGYRHRTKE